MLLFASLTGLLIVASGHMATVGATTEDAQLSAAGVKVIVVGAGASGLAAASKLMESGVSNVVVLEASDRVGGRIHSDKFGADTVEMGAQWIHGQGGNAVYKIATEMGIALDPDENAIENLGESLFTTKGDELSDADTEYVESLEEAGEDIEDYAYKTDEPVSSFFDSLFANESLGKSAEETAKLPAYKDLLHRMVQSYDGCDNWKDLSIKGSAHDFQEADGEQYVSFKPGHSYSEVLNRFLEVVSNGSNSLRLNSEVVKIEHDQAGGGVKVVLANEQELTADYVIVTVSLAVLKAKAEKIFSPALSARKTEAIQKIGIGSNAKVYLRYATAWWPSDSEGFSFLFDNDDASAFSYSESEAESDWTRSVLGMYRVINRPDLLEAWVAGPAARKMETLSDDQIKADLQALAKRFLGKTYPQLPEPTEIKVSRWHSNPFVLGSWSFQTVASTASGLGPADLAQPEMDGRLLFAGEATHDYHFSTTHGAVESGWREAHRIIDSLKQ